MKNPLILQIRKIFDKILSYRFVKFLIVGFSGIIVNMALLYMLTEIAGLYYMFSSIVAIEISIISNFFLNNFWTWKEREKGNIYSKIVKYHITTGISAIFGNWLILVVLTELFGMYYLLSNLIGIAVGTISNYLINDLWTFNKKYHDKIDH